MVRQFTMNLSTMKVAADARFDTFATSDHAEPSKDGRLMSSVPK
jgi:hypothetical protein